MIVPALNEAETIQQVIQTIPQQIAGVAEIQVLVVDDGSTDETVSLAEAAGARVLSHPYNLGVGAALQSGLQEARRAQVDIAVNIDADGQFNPNHIPELIAPIIEGSADFTSASRFKDATLTPKMPMLKRFGNWGMSKLVSRICGTTYADVSCGFRAYNREALLRLVLHGRFTYTQESFISMSFANLNIVEVPLAVVGEREFGRSRVASNLFRYAFRASKIIFSIMRDYQPARFFNNAAGGCMLLSILVGAFFLIHYLVTGVFSPHLWAGFLSAFSFGIGLLIFFAGQIADMIARLRVVQEQQLYLLRKHLESHDDVPSDSKPKNQR